MRHSFVKLTCIIAFLAGEDEPGVRGRGPRWQIDVRLYFDGFAGRMDSRLTEDKGVIGKDGFNGGANGLKRDLWL